MSTIFFIFLQLESRFSVYFLCNTKFGIARRSPVVCNDLLAMRLAQRSKQNILAVRDK